MEKKLERDVILDGFQWNSKEPMFPKGSEVELVEGPDGEYTDYLVTVHHGDRRFMVDNCGGLFGMMNYEELQKMCEEEFECSIEDCDFLTDVMSLNAVQYADLLSDVKIEEIKELRVYESEEEREMVEKIQKMSIDEIIELFNDL